MAEVPCPAGLELKLPDPAEKVSIGGMAPAYAFKGITVKGAKMPFKKNVAAHLPVNHKAPKAP